MEQQWEWGSAPFYPVDALVVMSAPTLRMEKQSGWGQHAPLPCGRTRGDAEVGLVGGDVVDAMVFAGQDDVPVLQEDNPARQPEVRV